MKSQTELLEAINKEQVPAGLVVEDDNIVNLEDNGEDDDVPEPLASQPSEGLLMFPTAFMPYFPLVPPCAQALRPTPELGSLMVGVENIGETILSNTFLPPIKRRKGERGKDKAPRKKRRCGICTEQGLSRGEAETCPGRGRKSLCRNASSSDTGSGDHII